MERIKNYNLNPKLCRFCGNSFIYEKRYNTFCNHSCSAKFNNIGIVRNGESPKICIFCGRRFYNCDDTKQRCIKCEIKFNIINNIQVTDGSLRRYLIKTRGYRCEKCKNTEWNNKSIPIDLHHIDGNENNNVVSNGQLLCKNCHAQTDTYGRMKRNKISSK